MTEAATQSPEQIERDIRRTQDEMSRTVDKIGTQLTPRNLMNALLDGAESRNIDADKVLDITRRNPIALAMIAGGAIWLVSDSDAKLPSFGSGKDSGRNGDAHHDPHHRDYVSHMEKVEWQAGEDPLAYQRRRDTARANYFMVERRHDEDESGFRQRLDDVAEKFRQQRKAWGDQGRNAAAAASQSAESALRTAQQTFTGNPLVGGLAAAAVGAIFGTLLPLTDTEKDKLSDLGEKARDLAGEQKDKLTEAVRAKKDELVDKVEQSAQPDEPSTSQSPAQPGAGQDFRPANDPMGERYQQAAAQTPPIQIG